MFARLWFSMALCTLGASGAIIPYTYYVFPECDQRLGKGVAASMAEQAIETAQWMRHRLQRSSTDEPQAYDLFRQ